MLGIVSAGAGNLLLNIGPEPDGSVPPDVVAPLEATGRWLAANGVAAYGDVSRGSGLWHSCSTGVLSFKGNKAYFWCHWNGPEQGFGGFTTKLKAVRLLNGPPIAFRQEGFHIGLAGCPETSPDPIAGVTIYEMEFESPPAVSFRALLPHIHV
jgi:alpha-L-fucosidase